MSVIPALGALVLVIPFAELFRPGQPVPYSLFPYIAIAIAVAAMVIAWAARPPSPVDGLRGGHGLHRIVMHLYPDYKSRILHRLLCGSG